jgi:hypothetical protein
MAKAGKAAKGHVARAMAIGIVIATACLGASDGERVRFQVLREGVEPVHCSGSRPFVGALSHSEWRELYAAAAGCRGFDAAFAVPPLGAGEAGVAAWWSSPACPESRVKTTSVRRSGSTMTVSATARHPDGCRTTGSLALQSFLAVPVPSLGRVGTIRFVLDGVEVGRIDVPRP